MGRTASRRWLHLIEADFGNEDAELRYEAARAAGEIADPQVLQALAKLSEDEDIEVRQAAITAMGRIGGPAATRILRRLAETAAEPDQEAVEEALAESESFVDPLSFRP
jgi:HEAT repeat protein